MDSHTDPRDLFRAAASEAGFALCGFTAPDPPADYHRYADWISAGLHAGMDYLAAPAAMEARADPRVLLPEARSIVCLAAVYPPARSGMAGVAAYAQGDDYHEVLSRRLWRLCAILDEWSGRPLRHKAYTDSGALLERELASRAGLGWIGKNSMLIHPSVGSFFFLAEILTEFSFIPDAPFAADRCGSCDRCRRACPAECIREDRTVDARRCLSYLTIENRGVIPQDQVSVLGGRIFGCDACQAACPWNRFAPEVADSAFRPRAHFPIRDLARELTLGETEYAARFHRSPLRRTRRNGYLRNVAAALGKGDPEAVLPQLIRLLDHPDPIVRAQAAISLGRLQTVEARRAIQSALERETEEEVLEAIHRALEPE